MTGGTIWTKRNPQSAQQRFELVNVTTIDRFALALGAERDSVSRGRWLEGVRGFDLIKIDAEGKDREVMLGGLRQIKNYVKIFTFECAPCTIRAHELEMIEDWGFSCYSLTRAGRPPP